MVYTTNPIVHGRSSEDETSSDDEEMEMPSAIEIGEGDDEMGNAECEEEENGNVSDDGEDRVDLPNDSLDDDGPLECDESAYIFYHEAQTGAPCLSFDIIKDDLGENRADQFPLTMSIVAGTQTAGNHLNKLLVMKMCNINKSKTNAQPERKEEEEEDESESENEEDNIPILDCAMTHHPGCVNRTKVTFMGGKPIVASWSELGNVFIWDISLPLQAVNDHHVMTSYVQNNEAAKRLFSFSGHQTEGYAMDWSPLSPGVLATGDSRKNIHLWKPLESGSWNVDQRAYSGHTSSVEDIQWSPNENNVMASCSSDKSIKIWDIRAPPDKACMLTKENAHESDVNVISWNKFEPFILSGGDDGVLKVWDLRQFPDGPPVCTFKHHTGYITSVEWHPTDSSVFAASGSDNQLTLWDLSLERDMDEEQGASERVLSLPSQILFIHEGQKEIKELHWHPQLPGALISTASTGFNIFRTISV